MSPPQHKRLNKRTFVYKRGAFHEGRNAKSYINTSV
jgi:hypothetical protein